MDKPNVILIALDTLRKDVLSIYGGNAYTPNLSEFANDAVIFPNPIAPSPWTVPSHIFFLLVNMLWSMGYMKIKSLLFIILMKNS